MRTPSRPSLFLLLLGAMPLFGCAAHSHEPGTASHPITIGSDLQAEVDLAGKVGRAIYEQDEATAAAQDALFASVKHPDPRVRGWVSRASTGGFTTEFVMEDREAIMVVYKVRADTGAAPVVAPLHAPIAIDAEGAAIFRARKTAMPVLTGPCGDSYNTVILPASLMGKEGWLVYLLAATTHPDEYVLAGHHRVLVSADGKKLVEDTSLSKSCIVQRARPPAGSTLEALTFEALVSDRPLESDFFNSLRARLPIYVLAGGKIWKVNGDHVESVVEKK